MKRTQVHLTDKQLASLRKLSEKTGAPIAALVRKAVDAMLKGWQR